MKKRLAPGLLLVLLWAGHAAGDSPAATLDALHEAGDQADPAAFVSLLTADAVVLGWAGKPRLAGQSLRDQIDAAFARGDAWNYRGTRREIRYSADGAVAWFDESLERDQRVRGWGSGVLIRSDAGWRVALYSLNLSSEPGVPAPVPAAAAAEPVTQSAGHAGKPVATEPDGAAPAQQRECRRMRHKTNKASNC